MNTRVLFGTKKGSEDWQEELITERPERIEDAKRWAIANGFDRLRVAVIDLNVPPDFAAAMNRKQEKP